MRLWLLLLLHVHWTVANTPPTIFQNCDAMNTLCYAFPRCNGGSGDGLVKIAQADTASLDCHAGFELDFTADRSWFVTMKRDPNEEGAVDKIALYAKKDDTKRTMADCFSDIVDELYIANKPGDASNCNVKIEAESVGQIIDPLADVFHLSYGQNVLCLEVDAEGEKKSYCTEPIKFDVFNADCQMNNLIGSGCNATHKICEQALEQDNVFSCPDVNKNTLFINGTIVKDSKIVRCTKAGWRSDDESKQKTGQFLVDEKVSPQCVSLCENQFVKTPNVADRDSQPKVTKGVMTCNFKSQAPVVEDVLQIGKPITCTGSKWTTVDGKVLEAQDGIVRIKCAQFIDQYLPNDCSSEINTSSDSCGTFTGRGGYLMCKEPESDALILYKGNVYNVMFANMENVEWEGDQSAVIGPIEKDSNPYCVFLCSAVFVNLQCDAKESCSPAKFKGEKPGESSPTYKSSLECESPESVLIINSASHFGSSTECVEGVWTSKDSALPGISVVGLLQDSEKPVNAHCHISCHESLILNNCNGEVDCKSATMKADKTIDCGDHVIEASADNWQTRTTKVETIFGPKVLETLQCSKQGWKDGDTTYIDFAKYPENDININCRSKCSENFVTCKAANCPTKSNSELNCPDDGHILWINKEKPVMQDLKCDPAKGWIEVTSGKLIVDFKIDEFAVKTSCKESCNDDDLISVDCEGHEGCVHPKLVDRKLTCDNPGTVMKVNGKLEFDHLKCSRNAWTKSDPNEPVIPRNTHNETIKAACLSKCDHSFIKPSACVADNSCDAINTHDLNKMSCTNPKDYLVVNSLFSASHFTCDPTIGWSNAEGLTAGDFSKNELSLEAHCFRNCDVSRIEDACNGGTGCEKFIYKNDVLSCPDGYVLNVNNEDVFEDVQCEAGGFKKNFDASFLLKFDTTNTKEMIRATCVSKCDAQYVKLSCDEEPCTVPSLSDGKIKCADTRRDLLMLGSTPVYSSSLHCDPFSGWKEDDAVVHDLTGTSVHVKATCRQPCNDEMVHVHASSTDTVVPYYKGGPLRCAEPKKYRLFINGKESGEVSCGARGWKAKDGSYPLKFTGEWAGTVEAECRHKCDERFVQQTCDESATCSKAIYRDHKLSCRHPSELLVIDGEESLGDITCTDRGWAESPSNQKTSRRRRDLVLVEKTEFFSVQVQCFQLCHPDFITVKPGAAPFTYSLGEKLTCGNENEMLVAQDRGVYSDLKCDKQGWRKEGGKLLFNFHSTGSVRKITAGCEQNDCLLRGFAEPCGGATKECILPDHTAYKISCTPPFMLVPDMSTMIKVTDLTCRDGKWFDDNNKQIEEADKTPMQLQCFAKECATCEDTLVSSCDTSPDSNCATRNYKKGAKDYCSRYECNDWWRMTDGDVVKYQKGAVMCDGSGTNYQFDDNSTITGSLDCVKKAPCALVSPLNTKCDGLNVKCVENLLDESEAAISKPVDCPAPNKLHYYNTESGKWEEATSLMCKNVQWKMEMMDGARRDIAKGERVICAPTDGTEPIGFGSTTTSEPTTHMPDPSKPCIGCRHSLHLNICDDCAHLEEGMLSFSTNGNECTVKSSSNEFDLAGGKRVYGTLHCKFENGEYLWRTMEGEEVAAFAAHKTAPSFFEGANKLGVVVGIAVLFLAGCVGSVVLIMWFRKREAQKRIAATTRGLEQKNDEILDAISVDSVKTLKL